MEKDNVPREEAHQISIETILAPADGPALMQDPPPNALSEQERDKLWRKLEALEAADMRLEEMQERKAEREAARQQKQT